jgi:hypothetical protein
VTLAACVLLAVMALAVPAHASFPGANGRIAATFRGSGPTDVWSVQPDGSGATNLTNNAAGSDQEPTWSADGARLAFASNRDGDYEIFVMDADGSNQTQITFNTTDDRHPTWSPDSSQIAFERGSQIWRMDANGSNETQLTNPPTENWEPSWSPDGGFIALMRRDPGASQNIDIYKVTPNGDEIDRLTTTFVENRDPDWSPDGHWIAWSVNGALIKVMEANGSNKRTVTTIGDDSEPVWAPAGTGFALTHACCVPSSPSVQTVNEVGSQRQLVAGYADQPSWQPVQPIPPATGYPRPKGATPLLVYLVPANEPCSEPNREHGPPLAYGACAPPTQTSPYLTVGTADSNGHATRFIGSVRLDAVVGNPSTADDADVRLKVDIADVLCAVDLPGACTGVLSDYSGELQGTFTARVTDRSAGYSANQPGTIEDLFAFPFTIPCAATPDPGTGGACALDTTFDAVVPGVIKERNRAIWQLGQIEVRDGGADGIASTDDNTVFAKQGIFVP